MQMVVRFNHDLEKVKEHIWLSLANNLSIPH